MKLTEHKNKNWHYFTDEQGRIQGECKTWWSNGNQWTLSHYQNGRIYGEFTLWHENGQKSMLCQCRDNKTHGERKAWSHSGKLTYHKFLIDGEEIIDFIANPELYPSTPEEKTMFALKYGNTPFIGDK